MTRQDAIEYDNWLKSGLMQEAEVLGLGEKAGSDLADRYITVIPDDERKGMVFLGGEAASYKLGNVRLDLKKAIVAALELAASVSLPESFFNYLQLLIVGHFLSRNLRNRRLEKTKLIYCISFIRKIAMKEELMRKIFRMSLKFGVKKKWKAARME